MQSYKRESRSKERKKKSFTSFLNNIQLNGSVSIRKLATIELELDSVTCEISALLTSAAGIFLCVLLGVTIDCDGLYDSAPVDHDRSDTLLLVHFSHYRHVRGK